MFFSTSHSHAYDKNNEASEVFLTRMSIKGNQQQGYKVFNVGSGSTDTYIISLVNI